MAERKGVQKGVQRGLQKGVQMGVQKGVQMGVQIGSRSGPDRVQIGGLGGFQMLDGDLQGVQRGDHVFVPTLYIYAKSAKSFSSPEPTILLVCAKDPSRRPKGSWALGTRMC